MWVIFPTGSSSSQQLDGWIVVIDAIEGRG
jgi:hypothetical protein